MKKVDSEDSATMAALERYRSQGSDLSQPMKIDFFVATPTQEAAEKVARQTTSLGFATRVEATDGTEGWTCSCTKTLIPSYSNVRAIEHELDDLARASGGRVDRFASFGNADKSN